MPTTMKDEICFVEAFRFKMMSESYHTLDLARPPEVLVLWINLSQVSCMIETDAPVSRSIIAGVS
jgi:hypothetical protein